MKTLSASLLLGLVLLLTSCASYGTKFDAAQVQAIKKGITTQAEIEHAIGKPMSVSQLADGRTVATWFYTRADSRAQNFIPLVSLVQSKVDTHSQTLQVTFNASGVVESFTTNESGGSMKFGLVN